jgi:hypothetical protein
VHQLVCFDAGGSSGRQQQLGAARAPGLEAGTAQAPGSGAATGIGKQSQGR